MKTSGPKRGAKPLTNLFTSIMKPQNIQPSGCIIELLEVLAALIILRVIVFVIHSF